MGGETGLAGVARAPASPVPTGPSTVTKAAPRRPASNTASSSARTVSSLAASRRTTCRFEITTPLPLSSARIRSQVICP